MKLRAEIVRYARAAAASGVLWGVIAGLVCLFTTYAASSGETEAHAVVAAATLAIGFVARARGGRGAGVAFATAFATLVPIFFLAGWHNANLTVLAGAEICGTPRLMRSAQLALVGALVAFALPLGLLSMRRPTPRRRGRVPMSVLLAVLAVAGGVLATIGAERLGSRPDIPTFRQNLALHAVIEAAPVRGECLLTRAGCDDLVFEDPAVRVTRHCYSETTCRLALDLKDGVGPRPPTFVYDPQSDAKILKDESTLLWALATSDRSFNDRRFTVRLAAQEGKRSWSPSVATSTLRGAIAPATDAVIFGVAGALLALLGAVGLRRQSRAIAAIAEGVDAVVGADGWVSVTGEAAEGRRPSPEAGEVPPGPVVVVADVPVDSYRGAAAPRASILAIGTKRDVVAALEERARERAVIVFVAALHLLTPLLASALAGRVF